MQLITDFLEQHTRAYPDKPAYIYTEDGQSSLATVPFRLLHRAVMAVSRKLNETAHAGKPALLLYENALEFTVAFLACQHCGITAVPMFFPRSKRHFERLELVIRDSGSQVVMCEQSQFDKIQEGFRLMTGEQVSFLPTSAMEAVQSVGENPEAVRTNPVSFIQYTSGSTGTPKGVVVTHANLLHNQQLIRNTFGCNAGSVIMSWLPFYHDMGLVGNLVHTVFNGCTCVLMSPYTFMLQPIKWMRAITQWKVTHSGGPNFAYDLCTERIAPEELAGVDLSSWQVAYNGSEPVSRKTITRFIQKFGAAGFTASAMFPCYGLAEATLLVSGGHFVNNEEEVTNCGQLPEGVDVQIIDPVTQAPAGEAQPGEICVSGESVTPGYWNRGSEGLFIEYNGKSYLRTGDTGYLKNGSLYISGRIKEMLIIRGENLYPYDIERTVFEQVAPVEPNGVIAFSVNRDSEQLVIAAELRREYLATLTDPAELKTIAEKIELAVIGEFQVTPFDVVLLKPRQLPRTSSGKLQRVKCRDLYGKGQLEMLGSKRAAAAPAQSASQVIQRLAEEIKKGHQTPLIHLYLEMLIESKTGINISKMNKDDAAELTEMGIDSIKAMEIINAVNKDLEINLNAPSVFQKNTYSWLVENIENLLWLKSKKSGEEVII